MKSSIFTYFLLAVAGVGVNVVTGQVEQTSAFDPDTAWSTSLSGTSPMIGSGNVVSLSPDEAALYVTLADGTLEVLDPTDGSSMYNYKPNPVAGGSVSCKSGVAYGDGYIVYAVIDKPGDSTSDSTSRIVAISHPNNSLLWESEPIPGVIQGTPVIGQSTDEAGNKYIYFTHNHNTESIDASLAVYGSFSFMDESGNMIFTEDAGAATSDPAVPGRLDDYAQPYSPVGIAYMPMFGRYPGGADNANDLLLWSTSISDGQGPNGYTRAFQIPTPFAPDFADSLNTTFLREVRWNSILPPIFSADGLKAIFGVRQNSIRGWTAIAQLSNDFSENGNVVETLTTNPDTPLEALQNAPVLSNSEQAFVVAAYTDLFSLGIDDGNQLWSAVGDVVISASPKVDPEDRWVYITRADGTVSAYGMSDGSLFWSVSCESLGSDPPCMNDLQGEFSVSGDGLTLYFGDALGNIVALNLDPAINPGSMPPTSAPTEQGSGWPSAIPSDAPSLTPTFFGQTYSPTKTPTIAPTQEGATPSPTEAPVEMEPVATDAPEPGDSDANGATADGAGLRGFSLLQVATVFVCAFAALL